jgi:hypothetical protein
VIACLLQLVVCRPAPIGPPRAGRERGTPTLLGLPGRGYSDFSVSGTNAHSARHVFAGFDHHMRHCDRALGRGTNGVQPPPGQDE